MRCLSLNKFVVVLAAVLALPVAADAGARPVGVYGIWWMPDRSDDDGYGAGFKSQQQLTQAVWLDWRVSYVTFSTPDAGILPLESTALVKLGLWTFGAGAGYYIFTGDESIENDFGWYLLVGLTLGPRRTTVFGEVKWQHLEPDLEGVAGGRIDMDGLAVHVGVAFQTRRR